MQVYKIDKNGYYIEPVIIKNEEIPSDCVKARPPEPMYKVKWNGTKWVEEGAPQEPKPKEPTENDMIMLAIAELDMQREIDKTETQLAIAELATTLLGGE